MYELVSTGQVGCLRIVSGVVIATPTVGPVGGLGHRRLLIAPHPRFGSPNRKLPPRQVKGAKLFPTPVKSIRGLC